MAIPKRIEHDWYSILGVEAEQKKREVVASQVGVVSPLNYLPEAVLVQVAEELAVIAAQQKAERTTNSATE